MAFFGPHNAELSQLNNQIKSENGKISGYQYTLGVLLLKKLDEGMVFDEEIMQQYEGVKAARASIENCNTEIQRIQDLIAEEEAQKAAEKERKQAEAANQRAARAAEFAAKANGLFGRGTSGAAPAGKVCPGCGNVVSEDMLFCNKCGTKLPETAPAPAPAATFCPSCGNPIQEGMLFCNKCGAKIG